MTFLSEITKSLERIGETEEYGKEEKRINYAIVTMKYFLCKIGPYLTILGLICAWMIGNDPNFSGWLLPLFIVSCILIIPGWIFGYKVWDMHIPPIGFAFMSQMDVFDAQWYSVLSWGVRFMSFPFIIATILILIFI